MVRLLLSLPSVLRYPTTDSCTTVTLPGVLYSDFSSESQYLKSLAYARQTQVLVHDVGPAKRSFFVTLAGHELLRSFVASLQSGMD